MWTEPRQRDQHVPEMTTSITGIRLLKMFVGRCWAMPKPGLESFA